MVFVTLPEQDTDPHMGGVMAMVEDMLEAVVEAVVEAMLEAVVEAVVLDGVLAHGMARADGMGQLMVHIIPWNLHKR